MTITLVISIYMYIRLFSIRLKSDARAVTQEQKKFLMASFEACPLPLYLRVIYNEALKWPSYLTGMSVFSVVYVCAK